MIAKAKMILLLVLLGAAASAPAQQLSFADGYHGGYFLTGVANLRDAFKATFSLLDRYPQYRVNLEIEGYTIDRMLRGPQDEWEKAQVVLADPATLQALRKYTAEGRLELIGGSYTQPLFYATSGESAIRQFALGLRAVRDAVGVETTTYAVQEPCYTSQLPQILEGFAFTHAALKNNWALFGNPPARSRELVAWEGPDGSRIDTSPRYVFNGYNGYALDIFPGLDFLAKATGSGIERPMSFNLGDFIKLSGSTRIPWFNEREFLGATPAYLRFATWNEYFRDAARGSAEPWRLTYDDFDYRFPWGLLGGRVQQQAASAELAILQAERIATMAHLAGAVPVPTQEFTTAWEYLLLAQHHDAWVCAPTVFGAWSSPRMYADWVDVWATEAERRAERIETASMREIASRVPHAAGRAVAVVCNTLPWQYAGVITLDAVTFPPGAYPQGIRAIDASGRDVPLSVQVLERHGDRSIRRAKIELLSSLPSFGYSWFTLEPAAGAAPPSRVAWKSTPGLVTLENAFTRVRIGTRGIESIYDREMQRELLSGPIGFTAMFPMGGGSQASKDVRVFVAARTPFAATARAEGSIGGVPFVVDVTLPAARRIDLGVSFDFGTRTFIGNLGQDAVEAWTRSDDKLLITFPLRMISPRVSADAAFDVHKPGTPDFQAVSWTRLDDAGFGAAFAVASDRATAYQVRPGRDGTDLGVVLAFGGPFEYAPDKSAPLRGKVDYRLALFTGRASGTSFETWRQRMEWQNPPRAFVAGSGEDDAATAGGVNAPVGGQSFLQLVEGNATLEAAYVDGDSLVLRLFNAASSAGVAKLVLDASLAAQPVRETRMDGADRGAVGVEGSAIELAMRPFEVKTLRIGLPTDGGR